MNSVISSVNDNQEKRYTYQENMKRYKKAIKEEYIYKRPASYQFTLENIEVMTREFFDERISRREVNGSNLRLFFSHLVYIDLMHFYIFQAYHLFQ